MAQPLGSLALELIGQNEPASFYLWCGAQNPFDGEVNKPEILIAPGFWNQHGPQDRRLACKIGRILDLLIAEPFGPSRCRGVGQIVQGLIVDAAHASGLLPGRLPDVRIAAMADAKTNTKRDTARSAQVSTKPRLAD
jgi:hypothetical protein